MQIFSFPQVSDDMSLHVRLICTDFNSGEIILKVLILKGLNHYIFERKQQNVNILRIKPCETSAYNNDRCFAAEAEVQPPVSKLFKWKTFCFLYIQQTEQHQQAFGGLFLTTWQMHRVSLTTSTLHQQPVTECVCLLCAAELVD